MLVVKIKYNEETAQEKVIKTVSCSEIQQKPLSQLSSWEAERVKDGKILRYSSLMDTPGPVPHTIVIK